MKNLLRRLNKIDDPARREEIEREAADRIKTVGSTRPAEADSAAFAPSAADTDAAQTEPAPAAPRRRLTAQQRAAARTQTQA